MSAGNCRICARLDSSPLQPAKSARSGAPAGGGCPYTSVMPKKRKKKIFSAAKIVREMARERVGSPKPSSLVPGKKKKAEKHKPTLGKLLEDQ